METFVSMARKTNARLLDAGDVFPHLELSLTNGKRLRLPADLTAPFNVVLVNRGAWCPFCNIQLKAFQAGLVKLEAEGIGVVSFSTDTHDIASAMVAKNEISFAVGYGAPLDPFAEALGVYYEPNPAHAAPHFHSAGFVLGPGGKVLNAVYSSGAIGRLIWQDVLGLVQYVKSH